MGALVAATALVAAGAVFASPAAYAAELDVTVSNPTMTDAEGGALPLPIEIRVGSWARFGADWSISGPIQNGDTFEVTLPTGFNPIVTAAFPLLDADGEELATCTYDSSNPGLASVITCTFENAPIGGYNGAEGDIWFNATATNEIENGEITWTIGGNPLVIPGVTVGAPGVPTLTTEYKTGGVRLVGDQATGYWDIRVFPTVGNTSFTITDELDYSAPNRPHVFDVSKNVVLTRFALTGPPNAAGEMVFDPTAGEVLTLTHPVTYSGTPLTHMTTELTGLEPGYMYQLGYQSFSTGESELEGNIFKNSAVINETTSTATPKAIAFGGGGGNPGMLVTFTLGKVLNDSTGGLLDEVDSFALTASNGTLTENLSVPANGTVVSAPYFPVGTPISLCETLPTITGVVWASPVISGDGVTGPDANGCYSINPAGGTSVALTLTNTATVLPPVVGSFTASKALTGSGAALVPATSTFTLNYTYPAGDDFEAGSGSLTLGADGASVASGELPEGAVLTFAEATPVAVDGATWGAAEIVPATLTITEGVSATAVVVTNPITSTPKPTPPVVTPPPVVVTPPVVTPPPVVVTPTPTPIVVTPTPTPTPVPSVDPTPTPTTPVDPTPAPKPSTPSKVLATTGSSNVVPAALGLGLLVLGGAALLFRRRSTV